MDKIIVAIGGGELKNKTTLAIDEYISNLAKERAGDKRAVGLFIGTASHDSMPYFNSFRKTYTSVFDIKVDCVLTVYGEMDYQKIKDKFNKADMIYVGGGDTKFMLDSWKKSGVYDLVLDAYNRGVIIAGLSAGAICWFKDTFTDYAIMEKLSEEYNFLEGIGLLSGGACPHYDERRQELIEKLREKDFEYFYGIENNSALVFKNNELVKVLSSGGNAYLITLRNQEISEKLIK